MQVPRQKVVLIADRDKEIRDRIARVVRQLAGWQPGPVSSSLAEVLEALRADPPPDALLLDPMLCAEDGTHVTRNIKQVQPSVPVILVLRGPGEATRYRDVAGVDDCLCTDVLTPSALGRSLGNAAEKAALRAAHGHRESELIETLSSVIAAFEEILALARPSAAGRGDQLRARTRALMDQLCIEKERWAIELATTLSTIGLVAVPDAILEKARAGRTLRPQERKILEASGRIPETLLGSVRGLDSVRKIIRYLRKNYDGSGIPVDGVSGAAIPVGARILRVSSAIEALDSTGVPLSSAIHILRRQPNVYDPKIVSAYADLVGTFMSAELKLLDIADIRPGMVFADDVYTRSGLKVVSEGQRATPAVLQALENFRRNAGLKEPIQVRTDVDAIGWGEV